MILKKIKPNNEDQEKDLEKRKVVVNTVSKLYGSIFNIYKTQYKKLSEYQKNSINVLNRLEGLTLDFITDDLPPMSPFKVMKKLS